LAYVASLSALIGLLLISSVQIVYANNADVDISVTESIAVSDNVDLDMVAAVDISVVENLVITDEVDANVIPVIDISVIETIDIADSMNAMVIPVIDISVIETIDIADSISAGSVEPVEIQILETIKVDDDIDVSSLEPININITESIGVGDSTGSGVDPPQTFETIGSSIIGKVDKVEDDSPDGKTPGVSAGSISSPKVITVITNEGVTVKLAVSQSATISNPLKPEGDQEIEKDWKVMISADQPIPTGSEVPREFIANATTITVVLDEPLGSHKRCTVIGKTEDGKASLACDDGLEINIDESGLPTGTNAVLLVHPQKKAKVVSTAKSLIARMDRFKDMAKENSDLAVFDSLKDQVGDGFYQSQEKTKSVASKEVKDMIETLEDTNKMIVNLASAFTSGSDNIAIAASDVDDLIDMLKKIASNPSSLVDVMVDGYDDDVPQESKNELKKLIKDASVDHLAEIKSDVEEAISLLENGDMENALEKLESATANDESWEEDTVMPIMDKFYADMEQEFTQDLAAETEKLRGEAREEIIIVREMLEDNTDWLDLAVKEDIESKVNELEASLEGDDAEEIYSIFMSLVEVMSGLPTAEGSQDGGQSEGQGSLTGLIDSAKAEIKTATAALGAEYTTPEDKQNIEAKIAELESVLGSNDRDTIYAALMGLAEAMKGTSGGSSSNEIGSLEIQCPPMESIGNPITCSFSFDGSLESNEWTGSFSTDGSSKKSGSKLFEATYDETGTLSLVLVACGTSGCKEVKHTIEIVEPEGSQGETGGGSHSSEIGEISSLQIHCPSKQSVGDSITCSFSYEGFLKSNEWTGSFSTDGSYQKSGSELFKGTYNEPGTLSVELVACGTSECKEVKHTIEIVES